MITREDRLGVLQALDLVRASLLASTVVLHEEVAAGVQASGFLVPHTAVLSEGKIVLKFSRFS